MDQYSIDCFFGKECSLKEVEDWINEFGFAASTKKELPNDWTTDMVDYYFEIFNYMLEENTTENIPQDYDYDYGDVKF